MAPGTYLIGEAHLNSIPAHGAVTVNAKWPKEIIPPETVTVNGVTYSWADSCLLVEVSPHDGPTPSGNHTWDSNNLCQRNITIVNPPAGGNDFAFAFVVGNMVHVKEPFHIKIERQNLPLDVKMKVDYIYKETAAQVQRFLNDKKNILPTKENNLVLKRQPIIIRVREYDMAQEKNLPITIFNLPNKRNAYIPILPLKEDYQMIALRGTGLNKLKKGNYQINVYQEDLEGKTEGGINFVIKKT
jgi:hypothetical protein